MQDVEDSELLEMMDICEQDGSLKPATQQDMVYPDKPKPKIFIFLDP